MASLNSKLKSIVLGILIFGLTNITILSVFLEPPKVEALSITDCSSAQFSSVGCATSPEQHCLELAAAGYVTFDAVCLTGGAAGPVYWTAGAGAKITTGFDSTALSEGLAQLRVNGDPSVLAKVLEDSSPGLVGHVMALNYELLEQRPLSGVEFIESKVYALTHPGQVRAQDENPGLYYRGTGFDLLKPVQSFWGWSVNIVYGLLIFLIIGVAFAIMFRGKLGGSAEVTIQTAIPNIALAMLLVPLSYAISGFIIDGMTIGLNVSHEFLLGPGSPGSKTYETRDTEYPCSRYIGAGLGPSDDCEDRGLHADDIRVNWIYAGSNINAGGDLTGFFQSVLFTLGITNTANSLPGWTSGLMTIIINLFVGIVLLLTGLRIFWYLMNKFLIFIIMPMFAPFYFATIAIPGQGIKSAMMYVKLLGSGSIAYIVAYSMTILSLIFASTAFKSQLAGLGFSSFVPPMTGFETILTGTGGSQVPTSFLDFYTTLIALGIYLLIPVFLKKVDQTLGTENMLPAFITDAVQSARDSINLGKQGVATFRSGVSAVRNTPGAIGGILNNTTGRVGRGLAAGYNRIMGVRAGESGSAEANAKQALGGMRNFAGNLVNRGGLARVAGEILTQGVGGVENAASSVSGLDMKTGGSIHDPDKPIKISAAFEYNGAKGSVELSKNQVLDLYRQLTIDPITYVTGGAAARTSIDVVSGAPGKLIITAENFVFPTVVSPQSISVRPEEADGSIRRGGTTANRLLVRGNDPFNILGDPPPAAPHLIRSNGYMKLEVASDPVVQAPNTIAIKFQLRILKKPREANMVNAMRTLFGTYDDDNDVFYGGILTSNNGIVSESLGFGLQGYMTPGGLKIFIKLVQ